MYQFYVLKARINNPEIYIVRLGCNLIVKNKGSHQKERPSHFCYETASFKNSGGH